MKKLIILFTLLIASVAFGATFEGVTLEGISTSSPDDPYIEIPLESNLDATGWDAGTTTHAGTNRTRISYTTGLFESVPANKSRHEEVGGRRAVLVEPAGANILLQGRNFDQAPWQDYNTPALAQDETGVDGEANKAWTFTDNSAAQRNGRLQGFAITKNNDVYTASIFVKKTTSATTFPGIQFLFKTSFVGASCTIDTNNGTLTDRDIGAPSSKSISDAGEFWLVSISKENNSVSDILELYLQPAVESSPIDGTWINAPQGSAVFDMAQLEISSFPSSVIDNDGVSEGAEIATGTLPANKVYKITADAGDHFFTGSVVNNYFISAGTETCDASNKVKEHGTVRQTESGYPLWDLPPDIFAEALGGEESSGTTSAAKTYKITATETDHFYVGSAVGEYFSSLAIGLDGNNKVQEVTNAWDGEPPHITLASWVRFGYDKQATGVNKGIISIRDSASSLLFNYTANGELRSSDGSTSAINTVAYASNTWYLLVMQTYVEDNVYKFRVGYRTEGGTIQWGTAQNFDGAFTTGSYLRLFYDGFGPTWLSDLRIYKRVLGDMEIVNIP